MRGDEPAAGGDNALPDVEKRNLMISDVQKRCSDADDLRKIQAKNPHNARDTG